jgi:hypothetical protein
MLVYDVAYLTSWFERTKLSEKIIEEDLSRVDKYVTRSIHKLGLGYERYEDKGEVPTKFVLSSTYKDEKETLKAKQISYPPNLKPSLNPKRAQKQTTNPCTPNLDGVYICMFCGYAGHFDEFYFWCKRIEKRHFDYAKNSYHDELIDFLSRSYSCALSRTYSRTLPQFSHGSNHHSFGFGSRENRFVPRHFGYGPCPHHGDHFLCRSGFPAGGSYTHFQPRHLDGPCFLHRGSHPTQPSGEMQRIVKTPSDRMVKCWIPKIYLTSPSTEPLTPFRPM